ncbi:MAG: restriction endonuclease [Gemmatimonadetes bacterium]|nr:restriction endonuclease [Gemmatimonadota bacterium]MYF63708.1 restriction endonuclease [Rhodothermaceae bacterium]MYK53859.1 restriction endonuclease [Gemmatimonadota bacterium]
MITPSPFLTCQEWENLPESCNLTESEADRLYDLARHSARRLKLPEDAVLTRTRHGLKAGQVVGILVIPRKTLEILPKIDGENSNVREALVRMLAVAYNLRVVDGKLATLAVQQHDLLEMLVRLFADQLLAAVRRGLPRRYISHEEDLKLLRGKLNVTRQITYLAFRPDLLACRFDELFEDTPLNRVLKAAVSRLAGITRSVANARLLAQLAAYLEFVGNSPDPLCERVRLDRTNTAFHDLYSLACLFLQGDWQSTTSGGSPGFSLLFPMNDLFEKFIGQSLKRTLHQPVYLQDRRHHVLTNTDGSSIFNLKPDAVINDVPDGPIILDTKWKSLTPDNKRTLGVEESDIYQMLAYGQAYEASSLILLYPWHSEMDSKGISRDWTFTGTSRHLYIETINVGYPDKVPEILRCIMNRVINHLNKAGEP